MPTPQRLPIVASDDGVWGEILRQYLLKEHYDDGTDNAANGGHKTITIRAGTASANTAPLKFTTGTLLTTPEAGAMEFAGDNLYITQTSGPTRKKLAAYDDSSGATGDIYYRNSSGYFTRLAAGSGGDFLTIASGIPSWTASIVGKALDNTNTITIKDTNFTLQDDTDTTKQLKFELSGITTATTRTLTVPDASTTIVGTNTTQTLTNKTITAPVLSGTVTGTYTLGGTPTFPATVVTTTGTQTLTNKTLTSPTLTTPRFASAGYIADNSGNEQIVFTTTASAVNEIGVTNAATGNTPKIESRGGDTNVSLNLGSKGTGSVQANGNPIIASVTGIPAVTGTPTSSTYLRGDGTWTTPAAGGDVSSNTATSVDSELALFNSTTGKSIKRATGTGIAKLTSGVLSTVAAPSGAIVGDTDAQTLTNKTISGSDNTISNLTVSNLASSVVITEAEGISSNDNDTTLPTSAAVKDYVDSAAGGSTNFVLRVAANDAPADAKLAADYICDGTADQSEINTAIAALSSGGRVELSEGTFTTTGSINLDDGITLIGQGYATLIFVADSQDHNAIEADTKTNIAVSQLRIDGNISNHTWDSDEDTQNGIYLTDSSRGKISNIWANDCMGSGITLGQNNSYIIVDNCHADGNNRNGIYMWYSDNNNNIVSNNVATNSVGFHGIAASDSFNNTFTGNTCTGNGTNGIDLDGDAAYNTVTGNTCSDNDGRGIVLRAEVGTPNRNVISSNTCEGNGKDGIQIDGAQYNTVIGNIIHGNSLETPNYYSGILVNYETTYSHAINNTFADNIITGGHGYALTINDALATGNRAFNNDFTDNVSAYSNNSNLVQFHNKGVNTSQVIDLLATGTMATGSNGYIDASKAINVDHTVVPSADTYGFFSVLRENASGANSNYHFGGYVVAQVASGNSQNYTGGLRGNSVIVEHAGSGTLASANSLEASIRNISTGTITDAVGLHIEAPTNSGGGAITNFDSILIETPTAAGNNRALRTLGGDVVFNDFSSDADFTIRSDNKFELFKIDGSADNILFDGGSISRMSSTETVFNDYQDDRDFTVRTDNGYTTLFVEGGTDRVGIGTGGPQAKLDVAGEIRASTAGSDATSVVTVGGTQNLTNKTLTSPKVNAILDTNHGVNVFVFSAASGAVNYLQANSNTTGNGPQLYAQGSDTDISIELVPKGTGIVKANGVEVATVNDLPISSITSGDLLTDVSINTHPEDSGFVTMPHLMNDIAYNDVRGGTTVWKYNGSPVSPSGTSNEFTPDATIASYTIASPGTDVITIEVTTHEAFNWNATWGIVMTDWCSAQDVTIEVYEASGVNTWNTLYTATNDSSGQHWKRYGAPSGHDMTAVRFTLSNFATTALRVTQIYALAYDSPLLSGSFLPRGGGLLYGTSAAAPEIKAAGGDTNIGLVLHPKGSESVTIYADSGQTPTLHGGGADTNHNLNLIAQGTGTVQANGVTIPTISSTDTLTNKRITSRVGTTTSSATPTINTDSYDTYTVTALAADITSMTTNLSGTPTNRQKLLISIKDDGTPRGITWGASFQSSGIATLLATTLASKTHHIAFVYDTSIAKWVCIAVDEQGY